LFSAFIAYSIVKKEVFLSYLSATVTTLHPTLTPVFLCKKPLLLRWLATGKSFPPTVLSDTVDLRFFKQHPGQQNIFTAVKLFLD